MAAKQFRRRWLACRPTRRPHSRFGTVPDVIVAFWRHAEVHYRRAEGTPRGDQDNLRPAPRPLRRPCGSTPARDFGPGALEAVREDMIDSGLGRRTVNRRVARIVRAFRWADGSEPVPAAAHHGLRAVAPLRRGRSGAREGEPVRPAADERAGAIRPHVSRRVWAIVRLRRLAGMRSGEA